MKDPDQGGRVFISYLVAIVIGIAVGLTVVADKTLTASRSSPKKYPKMEVGASLARRYIEVMGVSVLAWLAGAFYLYEHAEPGNVFVAIIAISIAYPACEKLDRVVQEKFGR